MKNKKNKNLLIFGGTLLFLMAVISFIYLISLEKQEQSIKNKINSFSFDTTKALAGMRIEVADVSCSLSGNCVSKNALIYIEKTPASPRKDIFIIKELLLSKTGAGPNDINLQVNELRLEEDFKTEFITSAKDEKFKETRKEFLSLFLPMNIKIDAITKVQTKDVATIKLNGLLSNNLLEFDFRSNVLIKPEPYVDIIKYKPLGHKASNNVYSDLKISSEIYSKLETVFIKIKNKNLTDLILNLYKQQMLNIIDNKKQVSLFNNFYLGVDKDSLLTKEEFKEALMKRSIEYANSIPESQKELKFYFMAISDMLNYKHNVLEISAKNIDGSSMGKFQGLSLVPDYESVIKSLYNSYEFKLTKKSEK